VQKIPYMLVVGDREEEQGTVSVRLRNEENLGAVALSDLTDRMEEESRSRGAGGG
jgi:threonyl-tRNA synthetase